MIAGSSAIPHFGQAPRTHPVNFGVHGADVLGLLFGVQLWRRGSYRRLGREILLRIGAELGHASLAAKKVPGALMLGGRSRFRWIDLHPAHWILHIAYGFRGFATAAHGLLLNFQCC